MTNISCILHLLVIYFSISLIRTEPPPLIFNGDKLEIYPDWETASKNPGPYAIACPAYNDQEEKFNEEGSLDHKALFVKDYAKDTENYPYEYMVRKKCKEYFKIAAVVRKEEDPKSKDKFIEFGYEVYNDKSEVNKSFKTSDFKLFSPLLPSPSFILKGIDFVNKDDDKTPYIEKDDSDDIYENPRKVDLDFIWLSRASMKYDFSKWHVERLTYFITQNDSDLQIECKNKNLGMQFYAKDNLYTYYLDGNQKTVFKDVTVPKIRSVYVSPHALLAPYQFQTIPSEEISCSSLVEVPIWYETAEEPLNYSEKFLVAASQVTSQRLKIIVGTYETLTLQTEKGNKPHEMFLNGKKIPIPKIIYKIVKFKSHNRGVGKRTYWFNAVIVIHNQPQVNKEDIICEDKSKYWGWESLRYMSTTNRDENTKSDFIYVCELDKDMQTKLGYYTSNELNLELDYFPSYNKKNARIEFENWQEKFETRMRDLFETTPEPVVDSNRSETQKEI